MCLLSVAFVYVQIVRLDWCFAYDHVMSILYSLQELVDHLKLNFVTMVTPAQGNRGGTRDGKW